MAGADTQTPRVLDLLEGKPCPDCENGTLVYDEFKGNHAVCCDTCGTPQAQIW